jgi:hypothetical protein
MKIVVFVVVAAFALPLCAAVRPVAPASGVLSVEFVDLPAANSMLLTAGSDAWVDFSAVSQQGSSRERSVRIQRRFAIRILRAGVSGGIATLTAKLQSQDGRSLLRIDGQPLTSGRVVIDARAAIGAMTVHTLEIEVPDTVAAGPLAASIFWEATTQQ